MEGIKERLNEIKDYYRLSARAFAKIVGVKSASTCNYLNGTKQPSFEFIDKVLSTYTDISADWLLRGKGEMFYDDKPTDEQLAKDLAEAKVKLLVQEGITKELRSVIENMKNKT